MSPEQRTRIKAILVAVGSVLTIVGIIVALVNDSLSVFDRFAGDSLPAPSSVSAGPSAPSDRTLDAPTDPQATDPQASPAAAASCRSAPGEAIDCQSPHRYEVYDGDCDVEGLISWLGGRSDIDVPRGSVTPSDGACVVDFKDLVTGSGAQAFGRTDSSPFRKCTDERSRSVVTCGEPHTAEYVAAAVAGIATEKTCEVAAAKYLGVEVSSRSDELRSRRIVSPPADGDNARCVIEVVGTERLAESVRDVQNAQLHWVS